MHSCLSLCSAENELFPLVFIQKCNIYTWIFTVYTHAADITITQRIYHCFTVAFLYLLQHAFNANLTTVRTVRTCVLLFHVSAVLQCCRNLQKKTVEHQNLLLLFLRVINPLEDCWFTSSSVSCLWWTCVFLSWCAWPLLFHFVCISFCLFLLFGICHLYLQSICVANGACCSCSYFGGFRSGIMTLLWPVVHNCETSTLMLEFEISV